MKYSRDHPVQDPGTKSYYKRYSTSLLDVTNLRAIRNTSANRKFANSIVVFASRRRETKRERKKKRREIIIKTMTTMRRSSENGR